MDTPEGAADAVDKSGDGDAEDVVDLELNENQVAELKEAFATYDPEDTGSIPVESLGDALRLYGEHPTEAELQDIVSTIEQDDNGQVTFQTFMKCVAEIGIPDKFENDDILRGAFRVFDPENTGIINASRLKEVLTTLGEKVTEDDVAEMLEGIAIDNDKLYYDDLLMMLNSK